MERNSFKFFICMIDGVTDSLFFVCLFVTTCSIFWTPKKKKKIKKYIFISVYVEPISSIK